MVVDIIGKVMLVSLIEEIFELGGLGMPKKGGTCSVYMEGSLEHLNIGIRLQFLVQGEVVFGKRKE